MTINITDYNSAFLFIDIQEKLTFMLKEKIKENIIKKTEILAKSSNILNIKTIVTEQYPKGLGKTILSVKNNLAENAKFFEKTCFNALEENGLLEELGSTKNIFVFGIETHICVYQTVINLLEKGYNVFVIKDACASRDKDEYKAGLNLMQKEGAKIITTEMVIFELLKTSKHTKFKEIQQLIK